MKSITFIDTEISENTNKINDIGGIRQDGSTFHANHFPDFIRFLNKSSYICGHNILVHDLTYLIPLFQKSGYPLPKTIDTLYLSPLFFPAKPYHRLIKDDKLQTEDLNNPLNDSIKARDLFFSELKAFSNLNGNMKNIYYHLLHDKKEFRFFFEFTGYRATDTENIDTLIHSHFHGKICASAPLDTIIEKSPIELAYCLALINCNDRYSITPPWILRNFPNVDNVIHLLRNTPCISGCYYCNYELNIYESLKRYFGFNSYRPFHGKPLQEQAVQAAVHGKSILTIFPTGGGKSITFQIPALMSGESVKGLTIVISPLQSLMKDQVDNLRKANITEAVTINGLLDPIERAKSIEQVENGKASILYISPESLRSKTIERLLLGRKIARFVIDEAHCFSSWGQDFRVDYLYIGDYIKLIQKKKGLSRPIPVSCFTATAKQKVIGDIKDYFKEKLHLELEIFRAPNVRTNLTYNVLERNSKEEKYNTLREIIEEADCPTIVYVARTKTAELVAGKLVSDGFQAKAFHGKMSTKLKTENQNDFIAGKIDIMVATSAFGMGVDKKDVGLVIHYEISDSLENYVQEAGRAGRDEKITASCYILFDEEDLSKHFILLNQTKLHLKEIGQVWRAIKELTRFRSTISQSALEIARKAGWDDNINDIETRVITSIAALEEAGYIKRNQNAPQVFADSIASKTVQEAIEKINQSTRFNIKQKAQATRIIKKLIATKSRKHANDEVPESRIDHISDHLGIPKKEVINIIGLLREEKILNNKKDLTAFIKNTETNHKPVELLRGYHRLERFLSSVFTEEKKDFNIKELREQAERETGKNVSPDKLKKLLNFLVEKSMIVRSYHPHSQNHLTISCPQYEKVFSEEKLTTRHRLSEFIINYLYDATEAKEEEKDEIPLEFSVLELKEAWDQSQGLFYEEVTTEGIEDVLFYLSRMGILQIEGGFLIIYNKLNIERLELNNHVQYKQQDYWKLEKHYEQKVQQIHIVGEYARKMIENHLEALQFVNDYFLLNQSSFLHKYFPGQRKAEISKQITPAKYRQVFDELSADQLRIVNDRDAGHIVVSAGPGSGKTKLLVHKLASLMMLEDVKHEQLLMLTFLRTAASEFLYRLRTLIGNATGFIEIKTFHSYCFDLLAKQGSLEKSSSIISDTIKKIKDGEVETNKITKTVLVIDEAQDMTEDEFTLITTLIEKNEGIKVIAVGDDDQNIYTFRGSDSRYMQRLIEEHGARFYELLLNYRSKYNLVMFANYFAELIHNRLKKSPVIPRQSEDGTIHITRHASDNMVIPLVNELIDYPRIGTTCVLTKTNDEAMKVMCLLQEHGVQAKLVQSSMKGFGLKDLDEIRQFSLYLNLEPDTFFIKDETWEEAKRKLKRTFGDTPLWEVCENLLNCFEQSYIRKYKSDWDAFLRESRLEDFYSNKGETIFISTIHKAKGKEFDNVFLLLDGADILSEEVKREIYVAITRAKNNLFVHLNGNYLDRIAHQSGANISTDNTIYSKPEKLTVILTHKDVWLDFFIYQHQQEIIKQCKNGMPLLITPTGCTDHSGNYILKFSANFKDKISQMDKEGYIPSQGFINFILYWRKQDEEQQDVRIILPIIKFVKK